MNRLTVPDERIDEHTTRRTIIDSTAVRERAMEIYRRLKAYEDTGLDPETCAEYKKLGGELVASGKDFNHLIELLRAEKEGRLTVLPGPDTSSVVQCRSCKHSYESAGGLYCAFGPCANRTVPYNFFCAAGRYKRNTGGAD